MELGLGMMGLGAKRKASLQPRHKPTNKSRKPLFVSYGCWFPHDQGLLKQLFRNSNLGSVHYRL